MGRRIVNNDILEMTDAEFDMFNKICKSYATKASPNEGELMFKNAFVSDQKGIITMLIPPSTIGSTMEIHTFLVGLMHQQHLRQIYGEWSDIKQEMNSIKQEMISLIKEFIKAGNLK